MQIIEYENKYLEDVKDLLVELEKYILSIDKDNLDQLHPEYREKMAILDLEKVKNNNGKCYIAVEEGKADDYLWFVRDFNDEGGIISSAVYFGDRLYAEKNENTIFGNDLEMDDGEEEPSTPKEQEETSEAIDKVVENGGEVNLETNVEKQTVIE